MKRGLLLFLISSWTMVCAADQNSTDFQLCKVCACQFDANDIAADVICSKPLQTNIFHDSFWYVNGTNRTMAYNSFTINYNISVNFTQIFPKSNLTYLNLAHNDIHNISKEVFRNLQNMKTLILSYNELDTIHPDVFMGVYLEGRLMPLRSLRELRLDHNQIHSLNQDNFRHITDLEILDLSFNPLEVINRNTELSIDELPSLKELYLQYTEIKTLPENLLHTLKYLRVLDLSGNSEFDKIPDTFGQTVNLQKLYLNNTGFTNLSNENVFPTMPSVIVLHLCRNEHLHHIGRHALSGLTNLTDLRLCDNIDLVTIDEMALAKPVGDSGGALWPPIRKLHIGNNKLSYLESEIIARWDALIELDIRGNPWTCECENQWLIDDLLPTCLKINEEMAKEIMCAAPIEMNRYSFYDIYMRKSHMRCLDMYGNRPENDGTILVGLLAGEKVTFTMKPFSHIFVLFLGILIAIPLVLLILYAYQRKWWSIKGFCDDSPASYSRRFYKTTENEEF